MYDPPMNPRAGQGRNRISVTGADSWAKGSGWGGADEGFETGDGGAWNAQAGGEIVEEGDFEFHAGLGEAEHGVAGLAAVFADGSAGDFALGDKGADVVFRGVGVERDFRPFEQALRQTVERRIAGAALEDAIKLRTQEARLLRARGELVGLQAPIEPPDHSLGDGDGVALFVVGGDELMDQALGVDPARRMVADAELAGVVGDDDGLADEARG